MAAAYVDAGARHDNTSPPRQQEVHIGLQDRAGQNTRWRFVLVSAACDYARHRHHDTSPPRQQGPYFRLQNVVLPTGLAR